MTIEAPVLLTVRGTHRPASIEAARDLHNQTAGSPAGISAARELGDLSHKVYSPADAGKHSVARAGELLFLDQWVNAEGIGKFFSNAHVATQGEHMFTSKDATVWMPATGAFTFQLEAPASRGARYVGMLRAPVKSIEGTIKAFNEMSRGGLVIGRRRGQISHNLYVKMGPPGEPLEVLGVDLWHDLAGLQEQYSDATVMGANLGFAGAPTPTVWEQAPGEWSEW